MKSQKKITFNLTPTASLVGKMNAEREKHGQVQPEIGQKAQSFAAVLPSMDRGD